MEQAYARAASSLAKPAASMVGGVTREMRTGDGIPKNEPGTTAVSYSCRNVSQNAAADQSRNRGNAARIPLSDYGSQSSLGRSETLTGRAYPTHPRALIQMANRFEENAVFRHGVVNPRSSQHPLAQEAKS